MSQANNLINKQIELEFLINAISKWAIERNLHINSTVNSQIMKLDEELGELSSAVQKDDVLGQMDGIGDVIIVMIVIYKILLHIRKYEHNENNNDLKYLCNGHLKLRLEYSKTTLFADSAYCDMRKAINHYLSQCMQMDLAGAYVWFDIAMSHILNLAKTLDLDLLQCLRIAYVTIYFRTGTIVNGVYVKDPSNVVVHVPKDLIEEMDNAALIEYISNCAKSWGHDKFKVEFTNCKVMHICVEE